MNLTKGTDHCLSRGAQHSNPDVNAVGVNGELRKAGQLVSEGEESLGWVQPSSIHVQHA